LLGDGGRPGICQYELVGKTGYCKIYLVNLVILTNIRVGTKALSQSVAGIPIGREEAVDVAKATGVDVLRLAAVLVGANGVALGAVVFLGVEVLCISTAKDVETVAVICCDDDQSLIDLAKLGQVVDGSLDSIIKLEELAESTVVVERVHLLVDGGSLGHDEPALVAISGSASLEHIDGLECHLLQTGLVNRITLGAIRRVLLVLKVGSVYVSVKPLRHVGNGKDTEDTVRAGCRLELGIVVHNVVASISKDLVVIEALVSHATKRW